MYAIVVDAAARLRFKNAMNRKPTIDELRALVPALQSENQELTQRSCVLEEQLRLERLLRYAPRSEKIKDRLLQRSRARCGRG